MIRIHFGKAIKFEFSFGKVAVCIFYFSGLQEMGWVRRRLWRAVPVSRLLYAVKTINQFNCFYAASHKFCIL